jgi:ubiquinol-cytochrome c reductase cytochrome c subunit
VRFLATRRRHPLAGLVVLLLGLVAVGALYSVFRPAVAENATGSETNLVAKGRHLFLVGCSSCHGLNAEGIATKRGGNFGPPLRGVGAAAVDFQVGTGRMPLQQASQQAQQKDPVYDNQEVRELAAYIASLQPGPAIPDKAYYDTSKATTADVVRGGEFFRTNCTACHNFAGSGGALPSGRYAPKLRGVLPRYIYEAMLIGPQQMPKFPDTTLRPRDKRDIIAYLEALQKQPKYGGTEGGLIGPVSEGLWAWLGGLGALILAAIWIGNSGVRASKKQ